MSLVIENLCKSFSTPVLKDVNLRIEPGSIHGLVGENGAGKSTLINILMGLLSSDSGKLTLDAENYQPMQVSDAFAMGFSFAAQELSLIDHLSVAENILLKILPGGGGLLNRKKILKQAQHWAEMIGLDPGLLPRSVEGLSLAQKQQVELAKALTTATKLLILDEPTAALTEPQAQQLHEVIRAYASKGVAVIYVSHRLHDVLHVCDTVSVLRHGEIQLSQAASQLTVKTLIEMMSGISASPPVREHRRGNGELRLSVKNITTQDLPNPISFDCFSGEILGIAGLAGSGRSEVLMAIYGLTRLTGGSVNLHQGSETTVISSAHQAVKSGMGMVAEDRKTQGIFADKSIALNMTVAGLQRIANRWGLLRANIERIATNQLIEQLGVKCTNDKQAIMCLSGGNQQKILIGRWMHAQVNVLLLDEPTRGVDPTAKHAIHSQLRELRDKGATIIVVSSEIDELTALCDRVIVLSNRQQAATLLPNQWSHEAILHAAFSAYH